MKRPVKPSKLEEALQTLFLARYVTHANRLAHLVPHVIIGVGARLNHQIIPSVVRVLQSLKKQYVQGWKPWVIKNGIQGFFVEGDFEEYQNANNYFRQQETGGFKAVYGLPLSIDLYETEVSCDEFLACPQDYSPLLCDNIQGQCLHELRSLKQSPILERPGNLLVSLLNEYHNQHPLVILDSLMGTGWIEFQVAAEKLKHNRAYFLLHGIDTPSHWRSALYLKKKKCQIIDQTDQWLLAVYRRPLKGY